MDSEQQQPCLSPELVQAIFSKLPRTSQAIARGVSTRFRASGLLHTVHAADSDLPTPVLLAKYVMACAEDRNQLLECRAAAGDLQQVRAHHTVAPKPFV